LLEKLKRICTTVVRILVSLISLLRFGKGKKTSGETEKK